MNYRNLALILHILILGGIMVPTLVFAQEFVPLTNLPGLQDFKESPDFASFLNSLYKLCIGAAAALAVFQIMRAGITFMTNKGSVSENEQAKDLIRGAVLGLLLVLSPVIVFGIINPKILELDLDVSKLQQVEFNTATDPVTGGDDDGGTGGDGDGEPGDDPGGDSTFENTGVINVHWAVYRPSQAAAGEWLDAHCRNNQIPAEVQNIVAERGRKVVGPMACPQSIKGTQYCNSADTTYVARCESDSKDFKAFRERTFMNQWNPLNLFDTAWQPIPGSDKVLFDRFSAYCTAEKGFINFEADKDFNPLTVLTSGCSEDDRKKLSDDVSWMCIEARLVCVSERRQPGS